VGGKERRYPLREKWVGDVAAYNEAHPALHTHFVRSGYLARDGFYAHNAGYNVTDPPLTRWVCAKTRDVGPHLICFVGYNITDPSMNQSLESSTNLDTQLFARHGSVSRDMTLNLAPNIRPPIKSLGFLYRSWLRGAINHLFEHLGT